VRFGQSLIAGRLLRRYKRFLADVALEDGRVVTAHCPNSGSMKTCVGLDWPAMLSRSDNPRRKLPYTLEMLHNGTCWIGVNTMRPNHLVREAVEQNAIAELAGYDSIRAEVPYAGDSRIDLLLENADQRCYVEIKNTTLIDGTGYYTFPDAVTVRGRKHLEALSRMVAEGHRAVAFFLVQRADAQAFRPADEIDPAFGETLRNAMAVGVEALAYRADVLPQGIEIVAPVPITLPG
jgi:sugar fermentation stimulation protein A